MVELELLRAEVVRLRTLLAQRDHEIELLKEIDGVEPAQAERSLEPYLPLPFPEECERAERAKPVLPQQPVATECDPPLRWTWRQIPPAGLDLTAIGPALWGDRVADGEVATGRPVGFWCRNCNVRVRARHTDPRLLCAACVDRQDEALAK